MDYDRDSKRLPYHGWEIRSNLTNVSFEGTVAAGAMLYFAEACKCHIMSCKQFVNGSDAIRAIETKAALWIDDRESNPRTDDVEPSLLHDPSGSVHLWVLRTKSTTTDQK